MANKKKKKNTTLTAMKKAQRDTMLSQGAQTLRASRVHKTLKDYSRKRKHKNQEF